MIFLEHMMMKRGIEEQDTLHITLIYSTFKNHCVEQVKYSIDRSTLESKIEIATP